jgi:hypothetical protein
MDLLVHLGLVLLNALVCSSLKLVEGELHAGKRYRLLFGDGFFLLKEFLYLVKKFNNVNSPFLCF